MVQIPFTAEIMAKVIKQVRCLLALSSLAILQQPRDTHQSFCA